LTSFSVQNITCNAFDLLSVRGEKDWLLGF
jgi:hypothetical protein